MHKISWVVAALFSVFLAVIFMAAESGGYYGLPVVACVIALPIAWHVRKHRDLPIIILTWIVLLNGAWTTLRFASYVPFGILVVVGFSLLFAAVIGERGHKVHSILPIAAFALGLAGGVSVAWGALLIFILLGGILALTARRHLSVA